MPPTAPDWDTFPLDVACAECGQELRGQTEPRCPECGIEFEWSDAVPTEGFTCGQCGYNLNGLPDTVCPECGTEFEWDEVLTRFLNGRPRFFRYRVRSGTTEAPDWDKVPFDVSCARCGADLRGQTEPRCPQCQLEFKWSEAVPIEQLTCAQCHYHLYGLTSERCPECGRWVDWQEALARYHRTRLPYFEYRWRDRPVRSLIGTWWRALRPRHLWCNFNLHDPPAPGPLLVMVLLFVLAAWCVDVFLGAATVTLREMGIYRSWGRPIAGAQIPDLLLQAFGAQVSSQLLWRGTLTYVIWLVTGLGSLLIFQESMRRFRVRQVQVLRVWAYSIPVVFPVVYGAVSAYAVIVAWVAQPWSRWSDDRILVAVALVMILVFPIWSLRCGYRHYLRMRHAAVVALSSQIIALLATFAIVDIGLRFGVSVKILEVAGRWLGIW